MPQCGQTHCTDCSGTINQARLIKTCLHEDCPTYISICNKFPFQESMIKDRHMLVAGKEIGMLLSHHKNREEIRRTKAQIITLLKMLGRWNILAQQQQAHEKHPSLTTPVLYYIITWHTFLIFSTGFRPRIEPSSGKNDYRRVAM